MGIALSTRRRLGRILLAAAVALLATGCGGSSPFRKVERGIARELTARIGPAERYEVRVSRSSGSLVAGRIPWVEVRGVNVNARNVLLIAEMRARLDGVHFDRDSRTIRSVTDSHFTARITAEAVTAYVRQRRPALGDVRVRLRGEGAVVSASPALLGIGIPVEVEGRPKLRNDRQIDFDASRVAVVRLGLPEFVIRRLEEALNPMIDLEELQIPARMSEVRVEADHVLVIGATTFATPGETEKPQMDADR